MDELNPKGLTKAQIEMLEAQLRKSGTYAHQYALLLAEKDAYRESDRRSAEQYRKDLRAKLEMLRDLGVAKYQEPGGMMVEFAPARPANVPEVVARPSKVGQDGLTAEEQRALYGGVFMDTQE